MHGLVRHWRRARWPPCRFGPAIARFEILAQTERSAPPQQHAQPSCMPAIHSQTQQQMRSFCSARQLPEFSIHPYTVGHVQPRALMFSCILARVYSACTRQHSVSYLSAATGKELPATVEDTGDDGVPAALLTCSRTCVEARHQGRLSMGECLRASVLSASIRSSGQVHVHACVCGIVCPEPVTIFDNQSAPLLTPSCKDADTRYCSSIAAHALARQFLVTQSLGCTMLVRPFIQEL